MIIKYFSKILLLWNKNENTRFLVWKGSKDPYTIWLSEIILQQTRVEQGTDYFKKFIKKYPTIHYLASANKDEVLKLWEGLGYYSRCRNLIFTAKQIVASSNGLFPDNYADLLKLKGIGTYTAAAIASFAYNLPYAVVDGNVYRVLSRAFGIKTPIDTTEGKKEFEILANKLLDKKQAAVYNQAIMDFGASVCKPANPLCDSCIFQSQCFAYKHHEVNYYPQKAKKKKPKNRYFHFAVCELKGKYAVKQRTDKDIWKGLYEFPNIEAPASTDKKRMASLFKEQFGIRIKEPYNHHPFVQKLTHQTIYAHVYSIQFNTKPANLVAYQWLTLKQIAQLPFPKIINDIKAAVL